MTRILRILRCDPDFCRGFRWGAGLILSSFVISQVSQFLLYPFFARLGTRLAIGWTMIVVGSLGMIVHLWITSTWLWYLLRREKQPFWSWFESIYAI